MLFRSWHPVMRIVMLAWCAIFWTGLLSALYRVILNHM